MNDSYKVSASTESDTVETLNFEPIKGYPMLQWRGKRPFTSTHFYPAQLKEQHGNAIDGWLNKIYWGDNLQVMSHLLKYYRGQVDLVYIDPPFDSKADYKMKVKLRGREITTDKTTFEEKQYGDIWTNDEYLQFMYERVVLLKELLSPHGSIAIHCDIKKSHHIRLILEEVFGQENFRGDIIVRTGVKNVQSQFEELSSLSLGHNNILLYSKTLSRKFKKLVIEEDEYKPGKWDTFWRGTDRKTMRYPLLGISPEHGQWRWEKDRANKAHEQYQHFLKNIEKSKTLDEYYLECFANGDDLDFVRLSPDGVAQYFVPPRKYKLLSNVWLDIPYRGTETDYPTEKNEAILQRLIEWATHPNDLVLDCFMGSGTTQSVSLKLGRRFLGADINLGAIQTTTKRLIGISEDLLKKPEVKAIKTTKMPTLPLDEISSDSEEVTVIEEPGSLFTGFEIYNVNNYDVFRNPIEAKDLLLEALELQKLQAGHLFDGERDGRMWKIMPINKITTRQDLNEIIAGLNLRALADRLSQTPGQPAEKITLVCMGHEPDLAATLNQEVALSLNVKAGSKMPLDVQVLDILRDRNDLQFKRDSEARVSVTGDSLAIEAFYPMNLLSKLSLQKEKVGDWREMVDSVMVDWNYDGAVFNPALVDIPDKDELVAGSYPVPDDAGTIRVKITDVLSESLELEIPV